MNQLPIQSLASDQIMFDSSSSCIPSKLMPTLLDRKEVGCCRRKPEPRWMTSYLTWCRLWCHISQISSALKLEWIWEQWFEGFAKGMQLAGRLGLIPSFLLLRQCQRASIVEISVSSIWLASSSSIRYDLVSRTSPVAQNTWPPNSLDDSSVIITLLRNAYCSFWNEDCQALPLKLCCSLLYTVGLHNIEVFLWKLSYRTSCLSSCDGDIVIFGWQALSMLTLHVGELFTNALNAEPTLLIISLVVMIDPSVLYCREEPPRSISLLVKSRDFWIRSMLTHGQELTFPSLFVL